VRFDALGERLERLNLDRNELEGPVPASLCQVHSLTELRLSNNHLNGLIPDCFNNSKLLTRLVRTACCCCLLCCKCVQP
jgi:Leucine-rich repeat (LRR) protein